MGAVGSKVRKPFEHQNSDDLGHERRSRSETDDERNFHFSSTHFKFIDESSPEPESIKQKTPPSAPRAEHPKEMITKEEYTVDVDDEDEDNEHDDTFGSDNDSGNASISSDGAHSDDEPTVQLRDKSSFSGLMSLNRLSASIVPSMSVGQRKPQLSHFERIQLGKIVAKCREGDLIELRCVCDCLKSFELRASLNSKRSRFRRSLHSHPQQLTTYSPLHHHQHHLNQHSHSSHSSLGIVSNFRRSFGKSRQVSLAELPVQRNDFTLSHMKATPSDGQCSENYHYVLVDKIVERTVHCFHVRPCQRTAIVDDDRALGVIKYESLEQIINSTIVELEDRHWQSGGRFLKSPKLAINYTIRNQEKLAQQILKRTLNATPPHAEVSRMLMNLRECYVKYHRIHSNAEHYVTLWRYGIGWSTWADGRQQILKSLDDFVRGFSQLFIMNTTPNTHSGSASPSKHPTEESQNKPSILVTCFGLHGQKLIGSMEHFMQCQIVIASVRARNSQTEMLNDTVQAETEAPDENGTGNSVEIDTNDENNEVGESITAH